MSAKDQIAAMLNELMGPRRNAAPGENIEIRFQDEEVCKHYLAGFCPNELFVNTKADLGPCEKIHDEGLRKAYKDSETFEKLGYERNFLSFIRMMHSDMQKKIKRNMDRLKITQPELMTPTDEERVKLEKRVEDLNTMINKCMEDAEALGGKGKIDDSQELVKQADKWKGEREKLNRQLSGQPLLTLEEQLTKPMEVCQTCGCFLIIGDAQQRIDEHYIGKQHVGYAKIKATIEEYDRIDEEKRKEAREEREKRDREREKDKEHRRSKDDRNSTSSSSRKRSRSKDKDRDQKKRHRSKSPAVDKNKDNKKRDDKKDSSKAKDKNGDKEKPHKDRHRESKNGHGSSRRKSPELKKRPRTSPHRSSRSDRDRERRSDRNSDRR